VILTYLMRSPEMSEPVELTPTTNQAPVARAGRYLISLRSRKLVGQSAATDAIVPYVYLYHSGFAPAGCPAGVFFLPGAAGIGSVSAIVGLLPESEELDCDEFQLDHHAVKSIGTPPGKFGHREAVPMLTQQGLRALTSEASDLALVL
jgi:ATP-dependent Clp protease ATP-binding subunit ClpA